MSPKSRLTVGMPALDKWINTSLPCLDLVHSHCFPKEPVDERGLYLESSDDTLSVAKHSVAEGGEGRTCDQERPTNHPSWISRSVTLALESFYHSKESPWLVDLKKWYCLWRYMVGASRTARGRIFS